MVIIFPRYTPSDGEPPRGVRTTRRRGRRAECAGGPRRRRHGALVGGSGLGAVALEGLAPAFVGGGPHQSTNATDGPRLPESRPQKREISERCCPNRPGPISQRGDGPYPPRH